MPDEKQYQQYGVMLALSILAVSATYLFTFAGRLAWGSLIMIPLSFGYTAYISRTSFNYASLAALGALIFVPLNSTVALFAVIVALGNIFVSIFAGGTRFRDFYSSTRIPLILIGAVLGTILFYSAYTSTVTADSYRTQIADFTGNQSEKVLEQSNLIDAQKEAQLTLVRETSSATVAATNMYVMNSSRENLSVEGIASVQNSFEDAQREIPDRVETRFSQEMPENTSLDMSSRVKDVLDSRLYGERFAFLIPMLAVIFASFQPVVGFLTAIFAAVTRSVSGSLE